MSEDGFLLLFVTGCLHFRFLVAVVLSESNVDIDKVLLKLDAKDFTVEKSTLQSLQQLIQWVADLTLSILVRLPENRCNHNRSGGVSGGNFFNNLVGCNCIVFLFSSTTLARISWR